MKTEFGETRSRLPKFTTVGFFCALVTLITGLGWTIVTHRSATNAETLLVVRKTDRIATYLGDGRYGINPQPVSAPDSIE